MDTLQLPPIPATAALFLPPATKAECGPNAQEMLDMCWGDDDDTINYFVELAQQMRIEDPWYSVFLKQCRDGCLEDDMHNFLTGLPTEHCGSWMPTDYSAVSDDSHTSDVDSSTADLDRCKNDACAKFHITWKNMAEAGST